METTYRVIDLSDRQNTGRTAANAELALLAAGDMCRSNDSRYAMEVTEWDLGTGRVRQSVVIDAEDPSKPWKTGV